MILTLSAPRPLAAEHDVSRFSCGKPELDEWLRRRAFANHQSGASRVFVSIDAGGRVFGYYALSAGAAARTHATGKIRRNMPDPIPVVVLGRLARDTEASGTQLGLALLKDAVKRAGVIADEMGVRAMVVHAIDAQAAQFYSHYGFSPSPIHPLTMMLCLN
ncbi:putative GNAT family N-acyltransferase [Pararobbsia alpina]|uniref:GNAT family N-acetyltransferase n=1 Tax=Pararobbsia alpina TaxID=621374 RepID=UPI0039A5996E